MPESRAEHLLRIDIFGPLTVTGADGADLTPRGRKARALILYLLRKPDHIETRHALTVLLWGDRGEEQARQSLRQTLYELRPLMDEERPLLIADRLSVRLDPAVVADKSSDRGKRSRLDAIASDLDNLSPAFDRWLQQERQRQAATVLPGSPVDGDGVDDTARRRESHLRAFRHWPRRGSIAAAAVALGTVAGVASGLHHRPSPERVIVVEPLRTVPSDASAERLSQDLVGDLSRAVLGHDATLRFADALDVPRPGAAFDVRGKASTVGGTLHAVVTISEGGDPAILWSQDYTAPVSDLPGMRQQISTNVAAVLVCALGARGVPDRIDLQTTALYLESCSLHSGDQQQASYLLRQVTERAPQFAGGWADLAVSLALTSQEAAPDIAGGIRNEANAAAHRALAIDPKQGNAYYARALSMPCIGKWIARERIIDAGLAADPDNPQLYDLRAHDLADVGRVREAIAAFARAATLDPLFPGKTAALIRAYANAGRLDEARQELARMEQIWPDSPLTWHARFSTAARVGDPGEALAMLDGDTRLSLLDPGEIVAWKEFLDARIQPTDAKRQAAIATLERRREQGFVTDVQLVSDFALLDRPAMALDVALHLPSEDDHDYLFRSILTPVRADPRFLRIARTQGLLAIWQATGHWPDFCADEHLGYDCRRMAASIDPVERRASQQARLQRSG